MNKKARKSAAKRKYKKAVGLFKPIDLLQTPGKPSWMTRAYENNRYIVMIDDNAQLTNDVIAIKAMVQRLDDTPIFNHWREMQNIKNEIFGPEVTAIEYYPAESNLLDDKNIYWLWILPEDHLPIYISNEK